MIKRLVGLDPIPTKDGAYSPSKLSLKLATSDTTDYTEVAFKDPNKEKNRRVLVVCTEESHLTMTNGRKFSTGNHPVEMFVPMLHLKRAGFEFDIFTPTGEPVKIEMWAMPAKDKNVMAIYGEYKSRLDNPNSLAEFASKNFQSNHDYIAIYFPGGHGALLGLPNEECWRLD